MTRRELLAAALAAPCTLALAPRSPAATLGGTPVALVTADRDAHVVALDLSSGRVLARVPTLPGPRSIEAALMTWAIVAHTASGRLSVLHAPSLRVRHVVSGLSAPRYAAVRPPMADPTSRPLAYVTDSAGEVVSLDVAAGTIVRRTRVPGPARHVTISADGETIWTALGSKAERVAVLDASEPRRPRLLRTLEPPFLAHDVVFSPTGRHVWVTSGDSRRLAVYERGGRRPVATIEAGAPPQHVAFVGDLAFVASGDDGTVRVHRADGMLVHEAGVPVGSYNVTFGWRRAVTPSLERGTVALLDVTGRVQVVRRVARAAHDACVVVTA